MDPEFTLRPATNQDQAGIIRLIGSVFEEYQTEVDLENAEADLLDLKKNYTDQGGQFWVLADQQNEIHGCHSAMAENAPLNHRDGQTVCTFKRLYLAANLRGTEWGQKLMQVAIDWAMTQKFNRVEFWSDSRFERAHRFFQKFGFETNGELRTMHDSFEPYQEFHFWMELD